MDTSELIKPLNTDLYETCEYISFQFFNDTLVSIEINVLKNNFDNNSIIIDNYIELGEIQVEKGVKSVIYPVNNYLVARKEIIIAGDIHYLIHIQPNLSKTIGYNCWGLTPCEGFEE